MRSDIEPGKPALSMSDADFEALARLAQKEYGLSLAESKKPLVHSRLSRRLRALNLLSFSSYIEILSNPKEEKERLELISALTTNVTSFFRERHHFDTLREHAKESLVPRAKSGGKVRIWSSACSTGQEPYSIALTILSECREANELDIKILATDIDPAVVRRAKDAIYQIEEIESIPEQIKNPFIERTNPKDEVFTFSNSVKQLITFRELNLTSRWPFSGPFDVIFCRNVAIYFNQETQRSLWMSLTEKLREDGHLFIGHSERISGPAEASLINRGVTTYRKRSQNLRKHAT